MKANYLIENNMKMIRIVMFFVVLTALIQIAHSVSDEDLKTYKTEAQGLINRAINYENQAGDDKAATLDLLYRAKLAQKLAKQFEIPSSAIQGLNDKFVTILKSRVERQKLREMSSSEFNAIVEEYKTRKIADMAGQGIILKAGDVVIDLNTYKSPIFYSSPGFNIKQISKPTITVIIIIAVLVGGTILFFVLRKKGLISSSIFKRGAPAIEKEIAEEGSLQDLFRQKGDLMQKNQDDLKKFVEEISKDKGKPDIAYILADKAKELSKTWEKNILKKLVDLNKKIDKNVEIQETLLKKIGVTFEHDFNKAMDKDLKLINRIEKKSATQFVKNLEETKKALGEEIEFVIKKLRPEYNELGNALRRFKGTLKREENSVNNEDAVLKDLAAGKITDPKERAETLQILIEASKAKKEAFDEEVKEMETICTMGKKLGKIPEQISEETVRAERIKKMTEKEIDQAYKQAKLHFADIDVETPLIFKDEVGYEIGRVHNIGKLIDALRPVGFGHPSAITDVTAYALFKKGRNGKSDLYNWLIAEFEEPLADAVEERIDEADLPPKLTYAKKKFKEETVVSIDSENVTKITALRRRIIEILKSHRVPIIVKH